MNSISFPPIVSKQARVLVLGFDAQAPYAQRTASLSARGVALWDVLQSCMRSSSLDSDIDAESIVVNDFASFLAEHPHIHTVCFNGATAQMLYRRQATRQKM